MESFSGMLLQQIVGGEAGGRGAGKIVLYEALDYAKLFLWLGSRKNLKRLVHV